MVYGRCIIKKGSSHIDCYKKDWNKLMSVIKKKSVVSTQ